MSIVGPGPKGDIFEEESGMGKAKGEVFEGVDAEVGVDVGRKEKAEEEPVFSAFGTKPPVARDDDVDGFGTGPNPAKADGGDGIVGLGFGVGVDGGIAAELIVPAVLFASAFSSNSFCTLTRKD